MSKLTQALKRTGLTQAQLAERVGSSQPYISKLCTRAAYPSLTMAVKISRALGGEIDVEDMAPEGSVE